MHFAVEGARTTMSLSPRQVLGNRHLIPHVAWKWTIAEGVAVMKSRGLVVLFAFVVLSALTWMPPVSRAQVQQRAQAQGQAVTEGPVFPTLNANTRAIHFRDPNGHLVEVQILQAASESDARS